MLHLAGRIPFRVDVGNFLQLECSFQGRRKVVGTAEIQKVRVIRILPSDIKHMRGIAENDLHLLRKGAQRFDNGRASAFVKPVARGTKFGKP